MQTNIRDEIDRSFGDGPPVDDTPVVLDLGQRALRRRRLTVAVGTAVCCLVVGGVAWSTTGSSGPSSDREVAIQLSGDPTQEASGEPPSQYRAADDPDLGNADVGYGDDGVFLVRQGIEVIEYVENPLELEPPEVFRRVRPRRGRRRGWALVSGGPGGGASSTFPARQSFPNLGLWLDDQVAMQQGEPTLALVNFGQGAELVAEPGVEIVRQQADPRHRPACSPAGRAAHGGRRGAVGGRALVRPRPGAAGRGTRVLPHRRVGLPAHARGVPRVRAGVVRLRGGPAMTDERDAAFSEFVSARRTHLRRIAYALCGDWHRADDLVQTSLVKLYVAWPRLHRDGREEAYVRTDIVRADIDEHPRPWRRERPDCPARPRRRGSRWPVEERTALFEALQALPPCSARSSCCGTGSGCRSPRPRRSWARRGAPSRATGSRGTQASRALPPPTDADGWPSNRKLVRQA